MNLKKIALFGAAAAYSIVAPAIAGAQDPAGVRPAPGPAVQKIATAAALSTEPLGSISSVRELPNGRILVNDGTRRRLLLMDTTLHTVQVVLDSMTDVSNAYGTRAGLLIPFLGDSTLFLDPASYAVLVLDPAGRIAKVRSVWRVQDVGLITNPNYGLPRVDSKGRIVYRMPAQPAPPAVMPPQNVPWFPQEPDSAFIVAVNLDTRRLDTLGTIRTPKTERRFRQQGTEGGWTLDNIFNPLPSTDEWAVLADKRVAFVRGRDYRVEFMNPDGTITSGEKVPYDWQRLLDEDKQKLVDSVKTLQSRAASNQYVSDVIRWVNQYNGKYPVGFKVPEGFVPTPGFPKDYILPPGVVFPANYQYACPPGVAPAPGPVGPGDAARTVMQQGDGARVMMGDGGGRTVISGPPGEGARPGGGSVPGATPPGATPGCVAAPVNFSSPGFVPPPPQIRQVVLVQPSELPDYKPPFTPGSVRADEDGNLWVRTVLTKPIPGGQVFDVIDGKGDLVNRLQLPPGYTLVGFGQGKVVYLSMRDAAGIHLARVRLR